jgi:hypothetical protein
MTDLGGAGAAGRHAMAELYGTARRSCTVRRCSRHTLAAGGGAPLLVGELLEAKHAVVEGAL